MFRVVTSVLPSVSLLKKAGTEHFVHSKKGTLCAFRDTVQLGVRFSRRLDYATQTSTLGDRHLLCQSPAWNTEYCWALHS